MKRIFFIFFLFSSPLWAQLDTGDGSDGACNNANIVVGQRTYNCTTLTITGAAENDFAGAGGAPVIIRVQGAALIDDNFSFNATAGANGGAGGAGGNGGAGGGAGGTGGGGENPGSGSGAGSNGIAASFAASDGGGGGGGGGYAANGTSGTIGTTGGTPGAGGAGGANFGPQAIFENSFTGGGGGGSGGRGSFFATPQNAAGGGGGGGALRIIAGGNITITAGSTITANGAAGGTGASSGAGSGAGSGGGGAGGAVWLQSLSEIIIDGNIQVSGGAGTAGADNGGNGGAGSLGRIRLDDLDGNISGVNANNINPTPARFFSVRKQHAFESDIDCGAALNLPFLSFISNFILGVFLVSLRKIQKFFRGRNQDQEK